MSRCFVALELDGAARERIAGLVDTLRPRCPGVGWVRVEGIHFTLRFLGPTTTEQAARLGPKLAAAARACPSMQAACRGLGVFPGRGSPRVLWLGVEALPPLLALQAACETAAVEAGFAPEARAFRPHLTLGRWRVRGARPALPSAELGTFALKRLVLFESELRRDGSRYTPLAGFPLGA
jgi:2'-5' RNA ligase